MKRSTISTRILPLRFPVIGSGTFLLVCVLSMNRTLAQCPPIPTIHENGAIEGLVAEEQAAQAAVAAQGTGKFIVIFTRPIPAPSVNGVWVHRFEADGTCIFETRDPGTSLDDDFSPALLTIDEGAGRGEHQFPSIAMNRGADGRAEWRAAGTGMFLYHPGAFPDLTCVWSGPIFYARSTIAHPASMTAATWRIEAMFPRQLSLHVALLMASTAVLTAIAPRVLAGPLPLEDAWAELDGPQPRGPGDGVILRHSPLNTGGPASDSDFIDPAGGPNAWQYLADDIFLPTSATVRRIVWWGFYHLDNPPQNEVFQIRFLYADAVTGLPSESTIVQAELHMDVTRATTGRNVATSIEPREFRFQVDLAAPLTLEADTNYWMEIAQIGAPQSHYRWLVATPSGNGYSFRHYLQPDWAHTIGPADLAFELQSIPEPSSIVYVMLLGFLIRSRRSA